MELGEPINVAIDFVSDDERHNKKTCPWHKKGGGSATPMKAAHPDDDGNAMAPNDGGTLGRNMTDAHKAKPAAKEVAIHYKDGETLIFGSAKNPKQIKTYGRTVKEVPYDLQYAPHHCIPGNESLKGSSVVPFLGDDTVIAEFKEDLSSFIKKDMTVGYDVNAAANGAWLPSPYALSMANKWPSAAGIKAVKKRKGLGDLGETLEAFKAAYVAAAIEASGGRQFHMRHKKYSDKVRGILKAIGDKLNHLTTVCALAKPDEDDKCEPPYALVARLDALSNNLSTLLSGPVWRAPLFADSASKEYVRDLVATKNRGNIRRIF